VAPGEQQTGAVLVEEAGTLKKADHLVAEELLGGARADVGHGHPFAGGGPAAAVHEGMDVGLEIELISERLDDGDHPWPEVRPLAGPHGHQLADGLPSCLAERADPLEMVHEGRPKGWP
jgi:hypothetical protein